MILCGNKRGSGTILDIHTYVLCAGMNDVKLLKNARILQKRGFILSIDFSIVETQSARL